MIDWYKYFTLMDDNLYWRVGQRKGKKAGWVERTKKRKAEYYRVSVDGKPYYIHRIVYEMRIGPISRGMQIDHINGDGLDNSKLNLRLVVEGENNRNMPMQSNNTSGAVGVEWCKKTCKWVASISSNRKKVYLGAYVEFSEAVVVRKKAEKEYGYHENHGRLAS